MTARGITKDRWLLLWTLVLASTACALFVEARSMVNQADGLSALQQTRSRAHEVGQPPAAAPPASGYNEDLRAVFRAVAASNFQIRSVSYASEAGSQRLTRFVTMECEGDYTQLKQLLATVFAHSPNAFVDSLHMRASPPGGRLAISVTFGLRYAG